MTLVFVIECPSMTDTTALHGSMRWESHSLSNVDVVDASRTTHGLVRMGFPVPRQGVFAGTFVLDGNVAEVTTAAKDALAAFLRSAGTKSPGVTASHDATSLTGSWRGAREQGTVVLHVVPQGLTTLVEVHVAMGATATGIGFEDTLNSRAGELGMGISGHLMEVRSLKQSVVKRSSGLVG